MSPKIFFFTIVFVILGAAAVNFQFGHITAFRALAGTGFGMLLAYCLLKIMGEKP